MATSHVKAELLQSLGTADPYEILGIGNDATADEIKKAYRLMALKHHPDKGGEPCKFRAVSIAHSILSDPDKRAVFDQTGDVDESGEELDEASFEHWYDYYRQLFPPITTSMIDSFAAKYKGSSEEQADVLIEYKKHGGNMGRIMDSVMLAEVKDWGRIEEIILAAIKRGELTTTSKWEARKRPSIKKTRSLREREGDGDDVLDESSNDEEEDQDDLDSEGDENNEMQFSDLGDDAASNAKAKAKSKSKGKAKNPPRGKGKAAATKAAIPTVAKSKTQKSNAGSGPSLEELILSRRGGASGALYKLAAKYAPQNKGKGGKMTGPDINDEEFERIRSKISKGGGGGVGGGKK